MKKIISLPLLLTILILSPLYLIAQVVGYKGDIFYLTANPNHTKNLKDSYKFYKNGVLYIEDGKIKDVGNYSDLSNKYPDIKIVDYSGKLITPGFIDSHVHFPQLEMISSYGDQLLDWLNKYTFPIEKKYSDLKYANNKANIFLNEMINNGTTSVAIYATVSPNSVEAIFSQAFNKNMRVISGKVLMDRNAPKYLLDTPETAYTDSKMLIDKWHNKGRLLYAVTPRFAITSSAEELSVAKKLLEEFPSVYLQTHLAENQDEVAYVQELFPDSKSYLDVYDRFDLVGNHSIFGHSIYLNDNEFKLLHDKGAAIAFCPTSNMFLGSGLFNLQNAIKNDVKVGFGTDVGAGTSMSLLKTMGEGYKVTQLQKVYNKSYSDSPPLNSIEAFYYATLGAAEALDIDRYVGSFNTGNEADFLILNANKPNVLSQKQANDKTIEDQLFSIMMLGDDRTVEHVYIMGELVK